METTVVFSLEYALLEEDVFTDIKAHPHRALIVLTCPLLAESPQSNEEISNHPSWCNNELFQNHLIIDGK